MKFGLANRAPHLGFHCETDRRVRAGDYFSVTEIQGGKGLVAERLRDINPGWNASGKLRCRQPDIFRTHAKCHVFGAAQLGENLTSEVQSQPVAGKFSRGVIDSAVEKVHTGASHETGDKFIGRALVDVERRIELLQLSG